MYIYIKNNIVFKNRSDLSKLSLESIWIEIEIKNSKPIIFGCCYRPPETPNYFSKETDAVLNDTLFEIARKKRGCINGRFQC